MRYTPIRHLPSLVWKSRPIQLTFFVTKRCNAGCRFCFYRSRERGPASQESELSLFEIGEISRSLGSLLWLAFSGGEIFLRTDLVDIVDIFYKENKPALILLPTNGLLPSVIRDSAEEIVRRSPKSTVVVKLSLDGIGGLHDRLRGVSGAFDRVMESYGHLETLAARYPNLQIGVNTVFCRDNQDSVAELLPYVRRLPAVRTHTVSLIRGPVGDEGLKDVNMENYRAVAAILEEDTRRKGEGNYRFFGGRFKTAQDIVQRDLIAATAGDGRARVSCTAGRLTVVLTETGHLYPCESFQRPLGNVRRDGYDIPAILGSADALKTIRRIREENCACTHECYMMMNILFSPSLYPRLLRQYGNLLLGGPSSPRVARHLSAPSSRTDF